MNEDTHVYCRDCENVDYILHCLYIKKEDCKNCPCGSCFCWDFEDSRPLKEKPNYKVYEK